MPKHAVKRATLSKHYRKKVTRVVPRKRKETPPDRRSLNPYACNMCGIKHAFVCDCGCHHESHPFGQGCKNHPECDGYSQRFQRVFGETQDAFEARILAIPKRRK